MSDTANNEQHNEDSAEESELSQVQPGEESKPEAEFDNTVDEKGFEEEFDHTDLYVRMR